MKSFTKSFSILLTLFYISAGCSNKTFPSGNFQGKEVSIDGDLTEWDQPIRFVSSGGQVLYNVTNDDKNIYVGLETHDGATALKILRAGINVYIDPSGGKSKEICLSFPLAGATPVTSKENVNADGGKTDKNELRETLLLQAISFNAKGFKNMDNRLYDVSDKSRLKVAIKRGANNSLGYEAEIPLQYIFEKASIAKKSVNNMSVGIIINGIKGVENYNSRSNASGTGMHGGGRGGGRRGGGNRRSATTAENSTTQLPDRAALAKEDANWYQFKLAVK